VVGRGDRIHLVPGLDEHLFEDRPGFLVVPGGYELLRALLQGALRVQRVEDLVDPPLNRNEFASSCPPHSEATTGFFEYTPLAFRPATTAWPCNTPTVWPLNDAYRTAEPPSTWRS